jgi:hypothetical protein
METLSTPREAASGAADRMGSATSDQARMANSTITSVSQGVRDLPWTPQFMRPPLSSRT